MLLGSATLGRSAPRGVVMTVLVLVFLQQRRDELICVASILVVVLVFLRREDLPQEVLLSAL